VPSRPVPNPGANGVQYLFAEAFSGNTCKEGWLSPHEIGTCTFQSKHNIPNETRESPRRRKPKKKVPSSTKENNPRTKKEEKPQGPLPYYNPEIQKKNPRQRHKRPKMLQELFYSFQEVLCLQMRRGAPYIGFWRAWGNKCSSKTLILENSKQNY